MNTQTIIEMKGQVETKFDPWHAHNIHLQGDVYTMAPRIIGDEVKLRRITQIVFDLAGGSVRGLRVLDLACGEGIYGIEFARQGANVVGIEGREANIEKARFVKRSLALDNLDLMQDDVRNLSVEKYGQFDVVLCLGLLYHLDAPDVFAFARKLGEICKRICIVDTRVTLKPKMSMAYDSKTYHGTRGEEHDATDSTQTKTTRLGASLDNNDNFWLSRPTIYNLLSDAGFTSVFECHIPAEPKKPENRMTFIGIKGSPCHLLNAPLMAAQPLDRMPERPLRENSVPFDFVRSMSHLLPRRARRVGKRMLGLENPLT